LTFYWQVAINALANQSTDLILNEDNALVITGGW
jgi:hypothetical protein